LQDGGQGQLGGGDRRLALDALLIEDGQFMLKGVSKQLVAMVPQEYKQLGSVDTLDGTPVQA
jgi:hypothetical protein